MRRAVATALVAVLVGAGATAGTMSTSHTTSSGPYVVREGDTLSGIAAQYGTTPGALAQANGIADPDRIVAGQKLTITGGGAGERAAAIPARLAAHPERLALRPQFAQWAATYGVPEDLLEALAWVESGWQSNVVSNTGAVGIGQLMPDTVAFMGRKIGVPLDPFDADANIRMTARFLRYLLDANGGTITSALASYYQGLRSYRTGPVHAETLLYVATVLAVRPQFR